MKKNVVRILTAVLMLSVVFSSSVFAAEKQKSAWESFVGLFTGNAVTVADTQVDGVTYRTHIENDGWKQGWVSDGDMSGSEGRGLRLEGIEIEIEGDELPDGLGITYRTHIENDGWKQGWVSDGEMSGSEGRGLRLEGIEIMLTGENADDYTVLYRTHIQNDGWKQGWVADGEMSGSEGRGLRLEGIEIKIEQKTADLTAYEAALAAVTEADYTKASWAAYQEVVAANVVTEDNSQAEVDAATAIILDAQEDLVTKAVVTSATAATQNTITLQGAALEKLAVADITVKNITVSSVVASADGTSATVTLASDLLADTDTAVAVVSDGDTSNFTVKYTIAAQTLAVTGSLFDLNLNGQKLGLTLNGAAITADYLAANGYTVEFRAWNSANAAACNTLFGTATATTPSATGAIAVPQAAAAYTVNATVKKGSTILTSEKVSIQLLDLVNSGSSILSYKKVQTTPATNAVMNSTTMLVTEANTIKNVVVQYSPTNTVDLGTTGYVLETSNKNVISVAANVITAVAPGTATITIRVGTVTTTIPYTVAQGTRVPSSVTPSTLQVNGIISAGAITTSNTIKVVDQYGDPVVGIAAQFVTGAPAGFAQIKVAATGNVGGFALAALPVNIATLSADDIAAGKYNVPLTAGGATLASGQIQTVAFSNVSGTNVGSFTVKTTGDNAPVSQKAEYQAGSLNQTNSLNANVFGMTEIDLVVNEYNTSGIKIGQVTPIAGYVVVFDSTKLIVTDDLGTAAVGGVLTTAALADHIVITPVAGKSGTTPIQIFTNIAQTTMIDSRTITLSASTPKITAIGLKSVTPIVGTIDYTSVLNYTSRAGVLDPIVNNVTLSEASAYDVCLDLASTTIIYLDTNRDGVYTAGTDSQIGELAFTASGTGVTPTGTASVTIAPSADGTFTYTIWDTTPLPNSPKVVVSTNTVVVKLV